MNHVSNRGGNFFLSATKFRFRVSLLGASVVSGILPAGLADWIALQEGRQGASPTHVVDRVAAEVNAVARRLVEDVTGRRLPTNDCGLLPYAKRIWDCVEIHWRRFAEAGPIRLSELISRLESGQLGFESNITCNVLRDVVLAQAMELLEEKAAAMFETEYMPKVRIIAQRAGGAAAVERFGNLAADLIFPRDDRPPRIAGYRGAFQRKHALAAEAVRLGLPLTVNLVVHRANIERISDMVDLALKLKATRIEIAHVQYYGWALKNRSALMPTAKQVEHATTEVEELRRKHHGRIVIDAVVPDYHARFPKPCVGGWGRRSLNVTPSGRVLPCHAAESIPELEFWNVREHSLTDIWAHSPAFNAFRGTDFLPAPCAGCERREIDFGGCRCQAYLLTGDARATDPVCHLSPHHARVTELAAVQDDRAYAYRRM